MKRILATIAALTIAVSQISACASDDYSWAQEGVNYCQTQGIMTGDDNGSLNLGGTLSRAQMAKMLVESFGLSGGSDTSYLDVPSDIWYYKYAKTITPYLVKTADVFKGDENVSREEFAATLVKVMGLTEDDVYNTGIIQSRFEDYADVSPEYKKLLSVAVEKGYLVGTDGYLNPKATLRRAEVCVLLYRVLDGKAVNKPLADETETPAPSPTEPSTEQPTVETTTALAPSTLNNDTQPIIGGAQVSMDSAIAWAKANGASDLFIDAAQYYWKYGPMFGIRPEVMYAQAALETGFGTYKGNVKPEMNNFAGIKIYGATGDTTGDHETFATREDGVRAHYNHMCAYLGLAPIGEVHARYYAVKSMPWAGTIKTVEELGGKWCPDLQYGYTIVNKLLRPMYNY